MINNSKNKLNKFIFLFAFLFSVTSCTKQNINSKIIDAETDNFSDSTIITDCNYTFEEAISGTKAPKHIINQLELITVKYYSMDGKIHQGQVLVNKKIAKDIIEIFNLMLEVKFPVYQVIPIVRYEWNDEKSMDANNTYCFCYRNISFSKHALGLAIDINPRQNPLIWKEGYKHKKNVPKGVVYNPEISGTFTQDNPVVLKFKSMGYKWGHEFRRNSDTHHFEKR
jgi:hypothetical protein